MPTSKKSKAPISKPVPAPKYKLRQKLYFLTYYKDKPESIVECEVRAIHTTVLDNSPFESATSFSYTVSGQCVYGDKSESQLIPNFTEAARQFAQPFLILSK
jgi:hypothetical protein